jgi:hypothetical protein
MSNNVLHFAALVKSYFCKAYRGKSAAAISRPLDWLGGALFSL